VPELVWLELARTDLLGIVDYISDDNPDAAQRVKDDIEMKAKKLSEFPKMGFWGLSVLKRHNPLQPLSTVASRGVLTFS
jgi:hypothetical protein